MKKFFSALLALSLLLPAAALAGALPEDAPVTYPQLEMDEGAVLETAAPPPLEFDDQAVAENAPSTPAPTAAAPGPIRPGDKKGGQQNSLTIETISDIQFPSPFLPGQVNVKNPAGSTVNVQYMLRISVAELERQTGRTGYTQEQMAELTADPEYDPETSYLVLSQTKGIAPGTMVEAMTLGALPDGSTIAAGDYQAEMVMAAYDVQTGKRSMVGAVVKVQFHVLSDEATVAFDLSGLGEIEAFNPVTAEGDVMFGIQLSQQALIDGCGASHRTEADLAAQAADPAFDPAYEFLTIYESAPVAPGSFVENPVQLLPLPDGAMLPEGTYAAWLVRYGYDAAWNSWQMLDAATQLTLVVKAGDAAQ